MLHMLNTIYQFYSRLLIVIGDDEIEVMENPNEPQEQPKGNICTQLILLLLPVPKSIIICLLR